MKISEELAKKLKEYEATERQLQSTVFQINQLKFQLNEIEMALKSLKDATSEVYKSAGPIMIKTTKEEAEKDLKEKKEMFEVRLASLKNQEQEIKEKVLKMQKNLQKEMK